MCNACDARFLQVMRSYQDRSGRRDFMRGLGAIAAAAAAAGSPLESLAKAESTTAADQIFISKTIHTMNSKNAVVEAVAVRQGKIIALGSRKDLVGLTGRNTQVIDFGERVVLPGFVEPHMHSNFCSLRPWLDVGPFTTSNMDEALGKIKQTAATTALPWVQGKCSIHPSCPAHP